MGELLASTRTKAGLGPDPLNGDMSGEEYSTGVCNDSLVLFKLSKKKKNVKHRLSVA